MSRLPKSYAAELTKLPPAVLAEMCWELAATLTGRIAPAARVWDEISSTRDLVEAIQRAPDGEPPPEYRCIYECACGYRIVDDTGGVDVFDDLIEEHELTCPHHAPPGLQDEAPEAPATQPSGKPAPEPERAAAIAHPLTVAAETPKKELFE